MSAENISKDLLTVLRRLKLGRMLDTLPERFILARQQQMPHQDFLLLVLGDEAARRFRDANDLLEAAANLFHFYVYGRALDDFPVEHVLELAVGRRAAIERIGYRFEPFSAELVGWSLSVPVEGVKKRFGLSCAALWNGRCGSVIAPIKRRAAGGGEDDQRTCDGDEDEPCFRHNLLLLNRMPGSS